MTSKGRLEKIEKRAGSTEGAGSVDLWFMHPDGDKASKAPNGEVVPLEEIRKEPAERRIMIRFVRPPVAEQNQAPLELGGDNAAVIH